MKKLSILFVFLLLAPVFLFSQSVTFSPQRGFFTAPFQLTLSPSIGGTIRYTTDGSAPTTTSGTIYTDPISISTTAVIRAIEYNGTTTTPVMTHTYLFLDDVIRQPANIAGWPNNKYALGAGTDSVFHDYAMDPNVVNNPAYTTQLKEGLLDIPTLSVVMNKNDFWTMYDGDSEFPTSAELIYPKNPSLNEQFNCGIESHSHLRLKRSMRLVIKSAYFPNSLQSNIFRNAPQNSSNAPNLFTRAKIVLRAGNNRSWARNWNPDRTCYTRDQWYRDALIDVGGVGSHGTFVHLYVNGLYWGLYNPVERLDAGFESQNMGGAYADWMAFSEDGVRSGDATRFTYLTGTLVNKDMTDPANYAELQQYLDVKNFSDYLMGTWMTGMTDWPNNNYSGGNRNNPAGPVMFYGWDCEWSWDVTNGSNNGAWVHPSFRNSQTGSGIVTSLWHSARRNSDFMMLFADRVYRSCFNKGKLTDLQSRERWKVLNDFINKAIVAESARWGDAVGDGITRTKNGYWSPEVSRVDNLMNGNVQRFITALRGQGYYPSIDPPGFSAEGGPVTTGTSLTMTNLNGAGTIYYTINGDDPRQSGGSLSPSALAYAGPVSIADGMTVKARVLNGSIWSALHEGTYALTSNRAPVLAAIGNKTITLGQTVNFTASATDADAGQTLTYTLVAAPAGATLDPATGNFTWTPTAAGTFTFLVKVTDNGNLPMSDDEQITVTVNPPGPSIAVSSFTLVNADNEQDIQTLNTGATLNLATLPTRRLNIRANTSPSPVGSLVFNLSGTQSRTQTEGGLPYALFGDNSGNYNAWTPPVGPYTLVATPYSASGGGGLAGTALSVNFTVVDQPPTNQLPVANAGVDQTISLPANSTVLNGSGTDPDGTVVGYTWSQVSGPNTASFSSTTVSNPTVSGLVQGTYIFALVVSDNLNASSVADQVNVVVNPAPVVQVVTSFTLVNADNEQDIQTLNTGATLNLATLPTRRLNIRANTSPSPVGSLVFNLSGTQSRTQTEGGLPYALYGDNSGNYNTWTPPAGSYTLKATPFSGSGGSGTAGTALTVSFSVIDQPANQLPTANAGQDQTITLPTTSTQLSGSGTDPDGTISTYTWSQVSGPNTATFSDKTVSNPTVSGLTQGTYIFALVVKDNLGASSAADQVNVVVNPAPVVRVVTSFTLVNADNKQDIQTLNNGATLNLATLPTRRLNIRANTLPATVGSVVFNLTGAQTRNETDSKVPYALFGDANGKYKSWTPVTGSYMLKATPYSASGGGGTAGTALSISFSVINQPVTTTVERRPLGADQVQEGRTLNQLVFPNPVSAGKFKVKLPEGLQGELSYRLISAQGNEIANGKLQLLNETSLLDFDFSGQLHAAGMYYLHLNSKSGKIQYKLVVQK